MTYFYAMLIIAAIAFGGLGIYILYDLIKAEQDFNNRYRNPVEVCNCGATYGVHTVGCPLAPKKRYGGKRP